MYMYICALASVVPVKVKHEFFAAAFSKRPIMVAGELGTEENAGTSKPIVVEKEVPGQRRRWRRWVGLSRALIPATKRVRGPWRCRPAPPVHSSQRGGLSLGP
jgi:hypothetical protein